MQIAGVQGVEGDVGRDDLAAARQTKTASGSRTQKSNTSYSVQAAQRGTGPGSTNEQFEENTLPQMAINRQQNMSGNSKRMGRMGV
mmetsp:Transcript_29283/g.36380  ORF Transcript_29283/g.36380 Transcript_29283/m.36380 type:complete len:86 (+) Transcript_29283:3177-3434(+)